MMIDLTAEENRLENTKFDSVEQKNEYRLQLCEEAVMDALNRIVDALGPDYEDACIIVRSHIAAKLTMLMAQSIYTASYGKRILMT